MRMKVFYKYVYRHCITAGSEITHHAGGNITKFHSVTTLVVDTILIHHATTVQRDVIYASTPPPRGKLN